MIWHWFYTYRVRRGSDRIQSATYTISMSSLMFWVPLQLRRCVHDTTLCDSVCQWPVGGFLWYVIVFVGDRSVVFSGMWLCLSVTGLWFSQVCDSVCQWRVCGFLWYVIVFVSDRSAVFSEYSGYPTNKTDRHIITKILLKVALSTITPYVNVTPMLILCY
jgi:hypothetical protein